MQAGATSQFSAVPLNLAPPGVTVDHIVTGSWSKKAAEEAKKYCTSSIAAKGDNKSIPPRDAWTLTPGAAYVHYCDNETIQVRPAAGCTRLGAYSQSTWRSCMRGLARAALPESNPVCCWPPHLSLGAKVALP